jgi:hypothetical protein
VRDNEGTLVLVGNCDETTWRGVPSCLVTWAPVRADGVTFRGDGSGKDSITVLVSVISWGEKLPLFAIANGRTKRAEQNQLGSDATLVTCY